jgi:glycosyltransferase involved in cell wall biosynthesis
LELLKKNNAPSVIVLEGEYGGPGEARNAGLKFAIGKWICFWDSDDLGEIQVLSNWASKQVTVGYDLIVFRYRKVKATGNQLVYTSKPWGKGELNNLIRWGSEPGIWRCLFSARFVKGLQFPDVSMGEDQVYIARVCTMEPRINFSSEIIYSYFVGREGQLTNGNYNNRDIIIARNEVGLEVHKNQSGKLPLSKIIWCSLTMTILKKQPLFRSRKLVLEFAFVLLRDPRLFLILPKKRKVMR